MRNNKATNSSELQSQANLFELFVTFTTSSHGGEGDLLPQPA